MELGVELDPQTRALRAQLEAYRRPRLDPREAAREELARGKQALAQGHKRAAEHLLQSARRRFRELHDPGEAEALLQLGKLACQSGKLDLAQQRFARARALARRNQDTALEASALNGLGATESAQGRLDRARECYQMHARRPSPRGALSHPGTLLGRKAQNLRSASRSLLRIGSGTLGAGTQG